jgi:hypothetical protein
VKEKTLSLAFSPFSSPVMSLLLQSQIPLLSDRWMSPRQVERIESTSTSVAGSNRQEVHSKQPTAYGYSAPNQQSQSRDPSS